MLEETIPLLTEVVAVLAAGLLACGGLFYLRLLEGRWARVFLASAIPLTAVIGLISLHFTDSVVTSISVAVAISAGALAICTDLAMRRSPDLVALIIALCGLLMAFQSGSLTGAFLSSAVAVIILLVARAMTSARLGQSSGLGDGDVLMAGALGVWLVPTLVPIALLASVVLALAFAGFTTLTSGQAMSRQIIPFIPALCGGFGGVAVYREVVV